MELPFPPPRLLLISSSKNRRKDSRETNWEEEFNVFSHVEEIPSAEEPKESLIVLCVYDN